MTTATAQPGSLNIQQTRRWLWELRADLPMFVIYDHPTDWPEFFVARLHLCLPEPHATNLVVMDVQLDRIQTTMEALGLVKLMRSEGDDPVILETWI